MRYLILCGGGSRGAMEVGFAQALWEAGVRFDGIVGSSVGAPNGAFLAAGGHPDELATIWRSAQFRDVLGAGDVGLHHRSTAPRPAPPARG